MRAKVLFLACVAATILGAEATPRDVSARIVGGSIAEISQYPFAAVLQFNPNLYGQWIQACGGSILNNRSILSAASCFHNTLITQWRIRVGSLTANSGGTLYNPEYFIIHPNYIPSITDSDVAILRSATPIVFVPNAVQPASIAGPNYFVPDNAVVWAIGWGLISGAGGDALLMWEPLQHVQIWTVNQVICSQRYAELNWPITDEMLCAGWLDVGGRGQCTFDTGGPLLHNNVVVGITSFGAGCGSARFPSVNTRVSRFTAWIQSNA